MKTMSPANTPATPTTSFITLLLGRHNRNRVYLLAWLLAAALSSVATIALVTSTVAGGTENGVDFQSLGMFLIIAAVLIYSQFNVTGLTVDTCETAVEIQRREFALAIRYADLKTVEALSTTKLYGLLNRTTAILTEAGPPVIFALITGGVTTCIGLYTLYLSPLTFIVIIVTVAATAFVARYYIESAAPDVYKAQVTERTYMNLFIQLLDGLKEVKLNGRAGDDLQTNYISAAAAKTHAEKDSASRASSKAYMTIYVGFYVLVSAIVFAVPQYIDSAETVSKITYIAIFQIATLNIVLRAIPMLSRANQALAELEQVKATLRDARQGDGADVAALASFKSIALEDCTVSFDPRGGVPGFGPVSVKFEPGQIIAVNGPNGSGKTTLLRLICGLVHPGSGRLLVDGEELHENQGSAYRSLFAAVFLDSHLFDRFYGVSEEEKQAFYETVVELGIDEGLVATAADLKRHFSPAQKRRLMLAFALVQKRPVLILDDIEAGQDEWFTNKLHNDILPRLKQAGTTVVLAVHREGALTEMADQIINLRPQSAGPTQTENSL